jgi:tetratricopeptide (TPR) repeat protein
MNLERQKDQAYYLHLALRFEAMEAGAEVLAFRGEELLGLASYYREQGLYEQGVEVCDHAIENHGCAIEFYLLKASILMDLSLEELSLICLEEAALLHPHHKEIPLLRARALAALELYADALELLQERRFLVEPGMDLSRVHYYEALVYSLSNQSEQAFQSLKASLLEHPQNEDALKEMYLCVELNKSYRESISLHEHLLELDPYLHYAWYNLGHAYAYFGDYESAVDAFELAFTIYEGFEFAYRDCAELLFELHRYEDALRCYSDVLQHVEPDADLLVHMGQCYLKLERLETAYNLFSKAILLDRLNDEALYFLGECLAREGKYERAIKCYKQAIELDDHREEYMAALAEAYYCIENYDLADLYFREATEIAPETPEYWLRYATFLFENEQYEEALDVLEEAEEYAVGAELSYCRVACMFKLGFRQDALFLLSTILEDDFAQHQSVYVLLPELRVDREVQALIAALAPLEH